jgi:alpha-beta hydrolase superfamily lysophospholipase
MLFDASASPDKTFKVIKGATHYYAGQPQQLAEVTQLVRTWLADRNLLDANPNPAGGAYAD